MSTKNRKITLSPLILSALIIIADQVTKYLVRINIPLNSREGIIRVINDFFWLIHVRNTGAAFSIGENFQNTTRLLMIYVLPILLLMYLLYLVLFSKTIETRYKLLLASIFGGGTGNMIDRLIHPDGVVDFISIKFYGIFGMERFPTFNIADSTVVVCMILWFLFAFLPKKKHTTDSVESASNTHNT